MKESKLSAEAGQQHATAYDTHYTTKEIMDSLMKLARIHFDQKVPLDAEPASV